jgi:hypothetical protein
MLVNPCLLSGRIPGRQGRLFAHPHALAHLWSHPDAFGRVKPPLRNRGVEFRSESTDIPIKTCRVTAQVLPDQTVGACRRKEGDIMIRTYDMADGRTLDAPAHEDFDLEPGLIQQDPARDYASLLALRLMTVEEACRLVQTHLR